MKKRVWGAVSLVMLLYIIGGSGCKPTEKNYKEAYEAAAAKRQADMEARGLGGMMLQDDLNISKRPMGENGDSVWICHDLLSLEVEEGITLPEGRYGVVTSVFKMPANARAMSSDLREAGEVAAVGKSSSGKWYVITGIYPSLNEAAEGLREFDRHHKDFHYVGLPGAAIANLRR